MNDNYLLHNETAKMLYFHYAKDLPIINLCKTASSSKCQYNNAYEAFLLNDPYKLDKLYTYYADRGHITESSSDYEKFKAFCSMLPSFAGHPLYVLSHSELQKFYGCDLEINENNCDAIWDLVNKKIFAESITEESIISKNNIEPAQYLYISWKYDLINRNDISDLASLEKTLIQMISDANDAGCKIGIIDPPSGFVSPNPYRADIIFKQIKQDDYSVSCDDINHLDMQILRIIGREAKTNGWSLIYSSQHTISTAAIDYLNRNDVLPKLCKLDILPCGETMDNLEKALRSFALSNTLGSALITPQNYDRHLCYAQVDYFRRCLCSVLGNWVENGEYTSDPEILKNLIQKVCYYNLKEAIG